MVSVNTLVGACSHTDWHTVHTQSHRRQLHICVHSPISRAKGEAARLAWCYSIPHFGKFPSMAIGLEEPWQ